MKFHKMHGAGNDYVYVDLLEEDVPDPVALSKIVSHRNFGIGGDGLILICPSEKAHARMRMFNSDGSESEMCGNGIRCVAKYLHDRNRIPRIASIETGAGLIGVEIIDKDRVKVNMGKPRLKPEEIPTTLTGSLISTPLSVDDRESHTRVFHVTCVSMGNPHCIIYVPDYDSVNPLEIGPLIENHRAFPARTNVEFVQVISRTRLRQRTWERGSGETLACGTGASAVLVASVLNGVSERKAEIELLGGTLEIEWAADDTVFMTGPATYVFEGRW